MTHIALVSAAAGPHRAIVPPLVAGLCVMRQTHPRLYKKAQGQELTWADARNFLQPIEGQEVQDQWTLGWWQFCTGEEMPQEVARDYEHFQAQYHLFDKERIIPLMTNYIDDLEQRGALPNE